MTPHAAVNVIERDSCILRGPGDAFSGYAVIGLPFQSGHVLALRRFSASSLGSAYTSVWHRDPVGRWTFYTTVAPDRSCARYFGGQVYRNVVTPIELAWAAPCALRVSIGGRLTWQLTMGSSPMTRLLNTMTSLGTGHLNLRGRTPNGHRFVMNPRQFWLIDASNAHMFGHNIGPPGPLEEPATLEDMRIPQRGLFAVLSLRLARPTRRQATPTTHGKPCSPRRTSP